MTDAPRILWGPSATVLDFPYPLPSWGVRDQGVGSADVSASGIPEAFEIRWDYIREVRLPFFESQLIVVEEWFRWAQNSASSFEWYSFQSEEYARDVYLHSPMLGQGGFNPERDQKYPGLFWVTVQLRTVDGLPFADSWSED